MRKIILFVLCVLMYPLTGQAASGISVFASVNKTAITMEEEIILTVTIDGAAGNVTPQLPSMPAFNVYSRSSSKQIHNFHASSTFTYTMLPRFPGKAKIDSITVRYDTKEYKTDPIEIEIYRASSQTTKKKKPSNAQLAAAAAAARPVAERAPVQPAPANMPALERDLYNRAAEQANKDYFMVASISNSNPYVNQTDTLAVRFYYLHGFTGNAPYTPPTITNLFLEEIARSEGHQTIGRKTYSYSEIRYAVAGVTAGKASVGPATVQFVPWGGFDLSAFDRMFAALSQDAQTVQSNSLSLNIRPVPDTDQPKSFYGAVGSGYTIHADADRTQVEAGEAINITVKVNGPGNLKATSDLVLPDIPGFKNYDVVTTSGAVAANGGLKSYKIFKAVIVPTASGTYEIPPIPWSYFDPALKQYRTLQTKPISLQILPSSKTDQGFDFGGQADIGNGFQALSQDIHYLKSHVAQAEWTFFTKLASLNWVTYLLLTLLVFAGGFALTDKSTLAGKRTLAKIRAQLKNPSTEETISDALAAYLHIRYGIHTASLQLRDIEQALQKCKCPPALIEQFSSLWKQLDAARFAPVDLQGKGKQVLAQQTLELIKQMDKGAHV